MNKTLEDWRKEIDTTDQQLLEILTKRLDIVKEIGKVKNKLGKEFHDKERWQEVITSRLAKAKTLQLPEKEIKKLFDIIHEYSLFFEGETKESNKTATSDFFTNKSIGIIGFGSFGKLFYEGVLPKEHIKIFSPHASKKRENASLPFVNSIEDLAKNSDIIIPIVPIHQFENSIQQISPYLQSDTVVMDVCSVKEYPVSVMRRYLPKNIQWIATHPMFGPKTYAEENNTLNGMRIVMCSDSVSTPDRYQGLKEHFQNLGLEVVEMSAKDHDKMSASSHFFVKSMNIIAEKLQLHETSIDTIPAEEIFKAFKKMGVDDQIVLDMIRYNPYCKKIAESMIQEFKDLLESV